MTKIHQEPSVHILTRNKMALPTSPKDRRNTRAARHGDNTSLAGTEAFEHKKNDIKRSPNNDRDAAIPTPLERTEHTTLPLDAPRP